MKTPELYDNKGWFNPYMVYTFMAICLIAMGVVTYQGMQTASKAQEIRQEKLSLEKSTRESTELFGKLETIRKNEHAIEKNDKENEELKLEIRAIAQELPKYGIESKSKYIDVPSQNE